MGTKPMMFRMTAAALAVLALGGCSTSGMLEKMGMGGGKAPPAETTVQSGNPLAMPPDLRLKQPGAVADTYQPNTAAAEPVEQQTAAVRPVDPAPSAPQGDVYDQYGISKTKPDGTAKTQQELKTELRIAIRKKKQEANPGYGTFRNFGSIFSDG
jgi:hypothetical protein